MHFCFLAETATFQKVAQNLNSRLKRAIESRTQQHTTVRRSFLFSKRKGVTGLKLSANSLPIRRLPIRPAEVVCQLDLGEK